MFPTKFHQQPSAGTGIKAFLSSMALAMMTTGCLKGPMGPTGPQGPEGPEGPSGLKIAEIWGYHEENATDNIADEASLFAVTVNDISVVKFTDSSALVTINGTRFGLTFLETDLYDEEFSHAFLVPAAGSESSYVFKFSAYLEHRIRYRVDISKAVPTIRATVDADLDFNDNSDTNFPLVQQL